MDMLFSGLSQTVPLATSPKPLSSKYSFGLVKIIQIEHNCLFGLVTQKAFGTDCFPVLEKVITKI